MEKFEVFITMLLQKQFLGRKYHPPLHQNTIQAAHREPFNHKKC